MKLKVKSLNDKLWQVFENNDMIGMQNHASMYLSLRFPSQIVTITTVECVLVQPIIFLFFIHV